MSMSLRALRSPRAASERGSVLIEVLIGTLLLAMTTAAVLNGMDGAQKTGRKNRDRSVSATLAQQDLERMRSMPPSALSNLNQTRTLSVGGVSYTVNSHTEWVRDASGLVSCTSDNTEAEYLRLTATVNAPASPDLPVKATSLLTPPPGAFGDDTGTAAVKLTNRNGAPLANVNVDLEGPSSLSGLTNDLGCAIFGFIAADDWTAEVDGGLVTWNGTTPAQSEVTVAAGKTSMTQIELDQPASLRASFVTPAGVATQWTSISVANSKLTNGYKTFPVGAAAASKDATNLFPFLDGYGVFAGNCEANNPAVWDSDYFETAGKGFVSLAPGQLLGAVNVVVPQLHITAKRSDNSSFTDMRVFVREIDDDYECEAVMFDSAPSGGPWTSYVFDVPLPFGNYEVCTAIKPTSGGTWRRKFTGTSGMPSNRNLTGSTLDQSITMTIPTSGSSGQCTP
jgi:Tfp pilus assembly protein PilV